MARSRLEPHRAAILEAREAGTSYRALARTYGVAYSTMQEFITGYPNRHQPLQRAMYDTVRNQRARAERSRQQAEEGL